MRSRMAINELPDSPDGYMEPYEYGEVASMADLVATAAGWQLIGVQLLIIAIIFLVFPYEIFNEFTAMTNTSSFASSAVIIISGFYAIHFGTLGLHENLHKAVEQYFGYDVSVHYGFPRSYAVAEEQMISWEHNLVSLTCPLVLVSPVAYVLSVTAPLLVLQTAFGAVFLLNTVYSANDIRGLLFLLTKPRDTKTWISHREPAPRTYVYEPVRNQ